MSITLPKISICIPIYNGEEFLQQCLNSISLQTFRDFEVIVSDNSSTDNSLEILNNWKKEQDFAVKIYNNPDLGIGKNWNFAIKKAQGEYIKLLFQDDFMETNCLEILYKNTKYGNVKYEFVACKRNIIFEKEKDHEWLKTFGDLQSNLTADKNGNYHLNKNLFKNENIISSPFNKIGEPTATLIHKNIFKKVGYFNEELKQILDYEYYYRVLKKTPILILKDKLVNFRVHEKQATSVNKNKNINEHLKYFTKTFPRRYFWYLTNKEKKLFIIKNINIIISLLRK